MITFGIEDSLVERTLEFVLHQLALWRDDTERPEAESENLLNNQLASFLTHASHHEFPMVHFQREDPQVGRHSVDLGAKPVERAFIGARAYSKYESFLVFECKRLPPPSEDRKREYVVGHGTRKGGIERFKLGLHGNAVATGAIIGYLQSRKAESWRRDINGWIEELANDPNTGVSWSLEERLGDLKLGFGIGVTACESSHSRIDASSARIEIRHLWVQMRPESLEPCR